MRIRHALTPFPLLLAAYPILNLYATNVDRLRWTSMLLSLGGALAVTAALMLALGFVLKDRVKASLITSAFVVLFFSYGHVAGLLGDEVEVALDLGFIAGWHVILLPLWGILLLLAVFVVTRTGNRLGGVVGPLNISAVVLLALPLLSIGIFTLQRSAVADAEPVDADEGRHDVVALSPPEGPLPDIYYIVPDGYAREDILREHYDYDNSAFIEYLTSKGFYVASESRSNYPYTPMSLASSLNMQYLDWLSEVDADSFAENDFFVMIQNNLVARSLQAEGYSYVIMNTSGYHTRESPIADLNMSPRGPTSFENELVDTTLLSPMTRQLRAAVDRAAMLESFETLKEIPELDEPTFTFAHLFMPHPPFLFDGEGNPVPRSEATKFDLERGLWASSRAYTEQLTYGNELLKDAIDQILLKSETPPIIILQADHGWELSDGFWQEETINEELWKARTAMLNAYYLPGGGEDALYPSITPVNSFRLVMDYYLGADLGMLEDHTYYVPMLARYGDFPEARPPGNYGCSGYGYGYNYARETMLSWQEDNGRDVALVISPDLPHQGSYWHGIGGFKLWAEEDSLRWELATWLVEGYSIFFADVIDSQSYERIPDAPFNATLDTVQIYSVPCDDEARIRLRYMVDEGPELRTSVYEKVFPNPNDYAEQYRALALHLIDTRATGVVVVYPPNQFPLLDSRLQWGTELSGVHAVGESWPLDTEAATASLEQLAAQHADLHVVFLEESEGTSTGSIRAWLNERLRLVSEDWFGPVELLHYTTNA